MPLAIGLGLGLVFQSGSASDPTLVNMRPGVGALTWTGFAPSLTGVTVLFAPNVGALTWTGPAPSFRRDIAAGVGSMTWTGFAPTVSITGGGGGGNDIEWGAGNAIEWGSGNAITWG